VVSRSESIGLNPTESDQLAEIGEETRERKGVWRVSPRAGLIAVNRTESDQIGTGAVVFPSRSSAENPFSKRSALRDEQVEARMCSASAFWVAIDGILFGIDLSSECQGHVKIVGGLFRVSFFPNLSISLIAPDAADCLEYVVSVQKVTLNVR
jgi:hypothetical protein